MRKQPMTIVSKSGNYPEDEVEEGFFEIEKRHPWPSRLFRGPKSDELLAPKKKCTITQNRRKKDRYRVCIKAIQMLSY